MGQSIFMVEKEATGSAEWRVQIGVCKLLWRGSEGDLVGDVRPVHKL